MDLIDCPVCEHQILSRIGTICPNCGHTVKYFEGNKKRKAYSKYFALSIFIPFTSFLIVLFSAVNQIAFYIAIALFIALAIYTIPLRYKDLFFTNYEKYLFWGIWLLGNGLVVTMIYNLLNKF
ncbi:hypothetical protein [Arcobacter roscoffensis]|uniref:Zinc ribbon domain-containing protein n=1 Tax=Arcobacter roscoffensis TaxID=2961520 RepID=A0ABY5E2C5_9BACT|nr:hypothetical protein [Arcobacter roscoffensis]UTJ05880.1 hypothetical protein NJU99_11555 [Arcobacter roscoffensis]